MSETLIQIDADRWISQLFSSQTACEGGVVRRRTRDVQRFVGLDRLRHEVDRRGYRAVENGGHIVIFCNTEPITRL